MTFSTLQRVVKFDCHCKILSHLSKHPYTLSIPQSVLEKTASIFAMKNFTRQQVRDDVAKLLKVTKVTVPNNSWADIIIVLDRAYDKEENNDN